MKRSLLHKEFLHIVDPVLAELITDPQLRRYIATFLERECSVGEAAKELEVSPQAMLYWTRKLVKLGLLKVVREERRRGKPIKYYRSVADGFFIPFVAIPSETLEALILKQEEYWQKLLARNLVRTGRDTFQELHNWGICLVRSEESGLFQDEVHHLRVDVAANPHDEHFLGDRLLEPEAPALWLSWSLFQLSFEDAKDFQRELAELVGRYSHRRGAQRYLARLNLVPLLEE